MIEIREAKEDDLPNIIEVLRLSLGESKLKKSKEIWTYKHLSNPFGKSLILVALEKDKIVGVRAFMRWEWNMGNNKFYAFRAVDTATHPEYQGKGIFKKLTLSAIELADKITERNAFIFNTPNELSRPGYLKMGWNEISKIKVQILFNFPFITRKRKLPIINKAIGIEQVELQELLSVYNRVNSETNKLYTPKSVEYLTWRYETNPLQKYIVNSKKDYYLAFYVKNHKTFSELRISELIFNSVSGKKKALKFVREFASCSNIFLITAHSSIKLSLLSIHGKFGPQLTAKNINLKDKPFAEILKMDNWHYSLGDLELF